MKKLSILSVVSTLLVAGCVSAEKSSNPLSPSVAGPIPGVNITPPNPVEPRDGVKIAVDQQPVTLLLENAATNGERPLSYVFDVATDTGFTNKVFTREGVNTRRRPDRPPAARPARQRPHLLLACPGGGRRQLEPRFSARVLHHLHADRDREAAAGLADQQRQAR